MLTVFAGLSTAAVTEMANESTTFDNESNISIEVEWNDSVSTDSTADVTFHEESAWSIDGDEVSGDALASDTLSGTVAEFDADNVTDATAYDVELDSSSTTVTVNASDIADDGTVDLADHTSSTITVDDTILSVTASAEVVASGSIDANAGSTTITEYTESDGLEDGTEYRVLVEADDADALEVMIDGVDDPLAGLVDGSPGFGVSAAAGSIALVVVIGAAAATARKVGGN